MTSTARFSALREWARRRGAGRLVYRLVHRPIQGMDLGRQYGWPLMLRARWGQSQMRHAAFRLRVPAEARPAALPRICFLTGRRFVHQTLFCAHSLVRQLGEVPPFEFFSDGSLGHVDADTLQRVFPRSSCRGGADADGAVLATLPPDRFPTLHRLRQRFVLLRKLTDVFAGERGYRVFLDSDMLFWRMPVDFRAAAVAQTPMYMADLGEDGYTVPHREIERRFGVRVAPDVNSGLVAVVAERIDWDLVERVCAFLLASPGDQRLVEQTLWAVVLGSANATALDRHAYRVVIDPPTCRDALASDPVLLHYAWNARLPYHASEWRRYLACIQP